MAEARNGNRVKVHYTGRLDDGTVFDSTQGHDPLEFTIGEGQVISGFESAVQGMAEGESKSVRLVADEAYGPHRADMVVAFAREQVPPDLSPFVGQQIELQGNDGRAMPATIVEVTEEEVTVDANHPLAGQELSFEIELVSVG